MNYVKLKNYQAILIFNIVNRWIIFDVRMILYKNDEMNQQKRLDSIQFWLSRTTEEFDEWFYDGEELIIIFRGKVIERYDNKSIDEILKGWLVEPARGSN